MMHGVNQHKKVLQFRDAVQSRDIDTYAAAALELRRWMMASDPHYPIYHFTGPESWINDPNGPIYHDGKYHLFYQFDPIVRDGLEGWQRSARCWGHAVSPDLVHWIDWPIALWPDSPEDYGGVYSGNTFIDDAGTPCAMYTGNTTGRDGRRYGILAKSRDSMLTWEKQVVMAHEQRPNLETPVHHDGFIWKSDGSWYQLIGGTTGGDNPRGAAFLWTSSDLEHWEFLNNIAPEIILGKFWELPYLIHLGGRDLFFVGHGNPCWIGSYDHIGRLFSPDDLEPYQIDTGDYYSYNLNMTDDGDPGGAHRRLMHGWITGPPSPTTTVPYWQGAHSIPRVLTLSNGNLRQEPIRELEQLRGRHYRFDGSSLSRQNALAEVHGDALEIRGILDPNVPGGKVGFKVRVSPDGREYTRVFYDPQTGEFGVDGPTLKGNRYSQRSARVPRTEITMRIFVDRSIIEVYVQDRALTARIFPTQSANGVEVFSVQGDSGIKRIDIYEMKSMWE